MSASLTTLEPSDWDILFNNTQTFKIANTTLILRPLGLANLALVIGEAAPLFQRFMTRDRGEPFSWGSLITIIPELAEHIQTKAPLVLAVLSGLDEKDVRRLPSDVALELLTACIEINIKAQAGLGKKLMAVLESLGRLMNPHQSDQGTA